MYHSHIRRGDVDFFNEVALDVLLNSTNESEDSLLSQAVMQNSFDCCKVIYSRCPSLLYCQSNEGYSALHHAAFRGNTSIIKFLITADANAQYLANQEEDIETDYDNESLLTMLDGYGSTALHAATDGIQPEAVKLFIKADPNLLGMLNSNKSTALHWAVGKKPNLEIVKLLVEADPDLEYDADASGETPLLIAMRIAQFGQNTEAVLSAKIRKLLLKLQPTQGKASTGDKGWTPLHHAAYKEDISSIDDIIRFCPGSWEVVDNEGQNFLHLAAKFDVVKVVKYILETKEITTTILNDQDNDGNTPLHLAALSKSEGATLCLLYDPRVNKMTANNNGIYVLDSVTCDYDTRRAGVYDAMERAQRGDIDYFKLVGSDVLLKSRNEHDDSVLSKAVIENHFDCCKEICKRCPLLLYNQNNKGYTALHHAASGGKLNMLKFLISASIKACQDDIEAGRETMHGKNLLTMADEQGSTALHLAVTAGQLDAIKLLFEEDLDRELLGMVNQKKATALHCAVEKQNLEIVRLLVEVDPDMEYGADESGDTPLLMAMRQAQLRGNPGASSSARIRKFLLKMQPSQGKVPIGDNGWRPLHHAAYKGDLSAIEDILRFCSGCWEEVDNEGRNFLHIAAMYEHVKVVKFVLGTKEIAAGVLNGQGNDGKTPLHVAALSGNESMTMCLLYDPRVNKTTTNADGQNVLDSITFDFDKRKAGVFGFSDTLDQKDLKEQSDFDLVVGALIATVSFTAGITVPGGYNSDGPDKGRAVLSKEISFEAFVISNNFALIFSLYAVFSHFCTRRLHKKEDIIYQLTVATFCTLGAIFAMMVAFITGSYAVLANSNRLSITVCINCSFFFIFAARPILKVLMQRKRFPRWFCLHPKEQDGDLTNS